MLRNSLLGKLTVFTGVAGLVLVILLMSSGGARSTLSVLAGAAAVGGFFLTQKGMAEDADHSHRIRVKVLQGARRMIEKEGSLDDSRLSAILDLPAEQVTRYVDFGMNLSWLPVNPDEGLPAPGMGCLIIDLLKVPFTFKLFGKPVLMVDGNVCGRDHGSYLITLPPGPHRISVQTTHRRKSPGGISRTVLRETSHSALVKEGSITGVQFNPVWTPFSGGKFSDYS